eukprot:1344388-Rhodomonas_salina.3
MLLAPMAAAICLSILTNSAQVTSNCVPRLVAFSLKICRHQVRGVSTQAIIFAVRALGGRGADLHCARLAYLPFLDVPGARNARCQHAAPDGTHTCEKRSAPLAVREDRQRFEEVQQVCEIQRVLRAGELREKHLK